MVVSEIFREKDVVDFMISTYRAIPVAVEQLLQCLDSYPTQIHIMYQYVSCQFAGPLILAQTPLIFEVTTRELWIFSKRFCFWASTSTSYPGPTELLDWQSSAQLSRRDEK